MVFNGFPEQYNLELGKNEDFEVRYYTLFTSVVDAIGNVSKNHLYELIIRLNNIYRAQSAIVFDQYNIHAQLTIPNNILNTNQQNPIQIVQKEAEHQLETLLSQYEYSEGVIELSDHDVKTVLNELLEGFKQLMFYRISTYILSRRSYKSRSERCGAIKQKAILAKIQGPSLFQPLLAHLKIHPKTSFQQLEQDFLNEWLEYIKGELPLAILNFRNKYNTYHDLIQKSINKKSLNSNN